MKKLYLILVCCLAFVLTACPGGGITNARAFSGTALNADGKTYTGGAGKLFIRTGNTQSEVGTIKATGEFTINLPNTIAESNLTSSSSGFNDECKKLITEGKDAKTYSAGFISVTNSNGQPIGNLIQISDPASFSQPQIGNATSIQRIYSQSRFTMKGTCKLSTTSTSNIDVVFNKGWNALVVTGKTVQGQTTISLTTPSSLPNVKFYVIGNSVSP